MKPVIFVTLFLRVLYAQQTLTTETELANNGDLSHYFIYHQPGLSAMVYYHRSANGTELVEFVAGPAWKWGKASVDTYLGGSNDRRLIAAAVARFEMPGKIMVIGVSDPKIGIGLSLIPTAWYNRVLVGKGHLFFRSDGFWVKGAGNTSRSFGIEANWKFKKKYEIFNFTSYDTISHNFSATAGLRVNIF